MKHSDIIIALLALLVIVGVVWTLGGRKRSSTAQPSTQVAAATPTPATPPPLTPTSITSVTNIPASMRQQPGSPYEPLDPRWEERRRLRKEDPQYEWKTPIEFYGRVLDQNKQPIPGVEVDMSWTDMSPKGTSAVTATTDAEGKFSITGIQGKNLGIRSLSKDGYLEARKSNPHSFEYAGFWEPTYHVPDPANPVIFHMLKKGPSEPMIHRGPTLLGARNDGTPTSFDLITGRRAAAGSGDIAVPITRGPKTSNRFDWRATVVGRGGTGLIESNDEFMVMAPADGYQPQWTFGQKATAKFYVKTGDGKYARVEMRIIPEYNETAAVDLTLYLNPTPGSRNLEFDPNKIVKSP
jgi:hypothetical protein